jgi:hypothetical protein
VAELEDKQITRAILTRVLSLHQRAYDVLMALGREALRDPAVLSREAEDALTDARRAGAWLRQHGWCSDVEPRDHDALGRLVGSFFHTSFHVARFEWAGGGGCTAPSRAGAGCACRGASRAARRQRGVRGAASHPPRRSATRGAHDAPRRRPVARAPRGRGPLDLRGRPRGARSRGWGGARGLGDLALDAARGAKGARRGRRLGRARALARGARARLGRRGEVTGRPRWREPRVASLREETQGAQRRARSRR